MKVSLALGPRQPLSRQMAWGCFTTNLAFPGFGSLLAGRAIGYAQIPLTVIGQGLSLVTTIQAFFWLVINWTRLRQLQLEDPFQSMLEVFNHLRLPILGIIIFFFALLWALMTSLGILAQARADERAALMQRPLPPKLDGR